MESPPRKRGSFLGMLVALVGVCCFVGGFLSGGPDVVDGIVFGGLFLLAAGVIEWRRSSG
jgi:hypothetical protein